MKRRLEKLFVEHIISQDKQDNEDPIFLAEIIGAGTLSPKEALDVYRGDYNARLSEALQNKFEGVSLIAGDELFQDLAQLFLNVKQSRDPDLQQFGEEFPEWLKNSAPLNEKMKFLSEVAKVDLAFHHLFHLAPLVVQSNYSLDLNPAVIVLNPQAPIILLEVAESGYSLWSNRHEDELPKSFKWEELEYVMVFKNHQKKIMSLRLEYHLYHLILELKEGKTLEEAFLNFAEKTNLQDNSNQLQDYRAIMNFFQESQFLQNCDPTL